MLASLAGFLLALQAPPPELDLRLDTWFARLSGSMKFDEKPAIGDRVSLDDDLGVDGTMVPGLSSRVAWEADRVFLGLDWWVGEWTDTLERDRRWNESALSEGDTVRTTLNLFQGELGYERRLVSMEALELWGGAAARYLRFEAVLDSDSLGRDDDHIVTFAPALRASIRWRAASNLHVDVDLEAVAWSTGEMTVQGGAASAALSWKFASPASLVLGWRTEGLAMTKDNDLERNDLRLRGDGFLAGLEFRW